MYPSGQRGILWRKGCQAPDGFGAPEGGPEAGYVNGFDAPTKADLVILLMTQGLIPFGATLGDYDFGVKVNYGPVIISMLPVAFADR